MLNSLSLNTASPEPGAPGSSDSPAPQSSPLKHALLFLAAAVLLVALSRLAAITTSQLFPDEALYVWLSAVEPFGFSPHPPGVTLLARLGMAVLGRTEEGVRAVSFLLATLTPIPVYYLGRRLGGPFVAFWGALAVLAVPIFSAIGAITTPDAPQLFLWCVGLLCTFNALEIGRLRWWIATGAVLGLALFIKYIIVLFFPSLALCLLLVPKWRGHLRTPGPYLALLTAAAVFAPPFLLNQAATDWPALRYHLDDRQEFTPPSLTSFLIYQGLHFLYISPILYGLALGGMVWAGVQGWKRRDERLLFLFSFSAVMWLFFAVIALVTKRELSREQWDAPAYVPALLAAGFWIREKLNAPSPAVRRRWRRFAVSGPALGLFLFAVINAEGVTGRLTAQLGKSPLYANFRGWSAMAQAADAALPQLPSGPAPAIFLGNSFIEALQFDFYTSRPDTRLFTLDNSANERFGLQPLLRDEGIEQNDLGKLPVGTNAIYARVETIDPDEKKPGEDKRLEKLQKFFAQVEPLPSVEIDLAGRPVRRVVLYRCLGLDYP